MTLEEQIFKLAGEGWTAKEIGEFFGKSADWARRHCLYPPDGPKGWLSAIHRRKHRQKKPTEQAITFPVSWGGMKS